MKALFKNGRDQFFVVIIKDEHNNELSNQEYLRKSLSKVYETYVDDGFECHITETIPYD